MPVVTLDRTIRKISRITRRSWLYVAVFSVAKTKLTMDSVQYKKIFPCVRHI